MKKKKNEDRKKTLLLTTLCTTIALCVITILLIVALVKVFTKNNTPYYKVEERVEELNNFTEKHKELSTLGWLKVQGTNIDYPVIYGSNDLDFDDITVDFTWTENEVKTLTNRVFILGHNIRNVSSKPLITDKEHTKFEQLPSFTYLDFAKKNKYIQYTIDGKDYLYKIFSVSIVDNNDLSHTTKNFTNKELKEYIDKSLKESFYDYDADVNENDYIITLATCTRFFGPAKNYTYKIDARMVRDNEKVKNYSVKENNNYKQIEKAMEAGDENEKTI